MGRCNATAHMSADIQTRRYVDGQAGVRERVGTAGCGTRCWCRDAITMLIITITQITTVVQIMIIIVVIILAISIIL